jgi:small multidrug resistance family-3 protein
MSSIALFLAAAVAEIGGAYLIWMGIHGTKGAPAVVLGSLALAAYGVIATLQPVNQFGRVFAAYGGIFILGSLAWGMAFDGFRPDRYDVAGTAVCVIGSGLIMYAPR